MSRTAPTTQHLAAPLIGTGLLMAIYLLARPYGDTTGDDAAVAGAFASTWWIVAHLCGALALASIGRLALRLHDLLATAWTRVARLTGLAGAVLVLPYYGAETFGLYAVGRSAVNGTPAALELVDPIRNHPAALTTFGVGLLLLAVSGLAMAAGWSRAYTSAAAWPLGVLIAAVLPQFYLPPVGRQAFGVLYLLAAIWWLIHTRTATTAAAPVADGALRAAVRA
ncbi:MAG TPA: hypothetical protein GXZ60_06400 [Intrasporangiaceae bacterium]|nr:hypothetical protein [Intrasporangiaceae bacterium]